MADLRTEDVTLGSLRKSFELEELEERAREYMVEMYGKPRDMGDEEQKDRWRERFGLLVHFVQYGIWEIDRGG